MSQRWLRCCRKPSCAEDRLRYYASQFPVVEVDSTYYSLPERARTLLSFVIALPLTFSGLIVAKPRLDVLLPSGIASS